MHRVLPEQKVCGSGHDMALSFGSQIRWRCKKRTCRTEKGIRADNWFTGSKLSLETAAPFIYWWSEEMTSNEFCEKQFGISDHTVVDWNNYLREVCAWKMQQNALVIGGPGLTVEIDENLFTRRKNHAGCVLPQQWMFGGICRETKECFIVNVPDRSAATLIPIIMQSIRPGYRRPIFRIKLNQHYNFIGRQCRRTRNSLVCIKNKQKYNKQNDVKSTIVNFA